MRRSNTWFAFIVLVAVAVAWSVGASAQTQGAAQSSTPLTPEAVAGRYQGTATTSDGQMPITVNLKAEKGMVTGTVESAQGVIAITGSTITGDKVTLNIDMGGAPGTITGTKKGDRLEGTWTLGEESGTFALTRAAADAPDSSAAPKPPAAGATAQKPAPASGADPLTGVWDGITGNGDMSVPFTMNLKLEGEKVTGDISSEQGGAQFNPGVWKDGALSLSFDFSGRGTVTMIGAIKEGKLVGTMDFAGQMQLSWAAVRK